jgi:DNA polymerase-3 subunit gamma/tau
MLTNHAFNSMLKTLEEPPDHVKFILATTDPQKIPVTVLSRCLQFNLKQMPPGHIIDHLDDILGQEGISFELPALRLLAQGAHGSMRDALSLTDQAIAYAAGKVTLDAVQGMLGALDQSYLIRLLDALAQQDGADLLAVADEMAARSLSYNGALQDLGTLLHRIALAQTVPAARPADLPEYADIVRLAALFSAEEVQLHYQIVVHGRNELALAPDEYAGFSMTLLRMLAFRPVPFNGGVDAAAPPAAARPAALSAAAAPAPARAAASPASARAAVGAPAGQASHAPAAPAPVAPVAPLVPARAAPVASVVGSARAAALEAARAGSRPAGRGASVSTPAPPPALAEPAPPVHTASTSPAAAVKGPAPWEDDVPAAPVVAPHAPRALAASPRPAPVAPDDDLPPWVTEFSDDTASVQDQRGSRDQSGARAQSSSPPSAAAAIAAPVAAPLVPVPELGWDGSWPRLASGLPLRGVAQQLALQTELIACLHDEQGTQFRLRVPIETWRSSANVDKLAAALSEHFKRKVSVDTELGPVHDTASAQAQVHREARQRDAEITIEHDPFVQGLVLGLGATVVPGSITPALASNERP